jgi:hypothetical protein
VLDDDLLAQALEADVAGESGEPLVALPERLEQPLVAFRKARREALLD